MQNFYENTQMQSNILLHQLLSARSTGNIPVLNKGDLLPKTSASSSTKQLFPSSNSNDVQLASHSSPLELQTSTIHNYEKLQVPKIAFTYKQLTGLQPLTITCYMTTPTNSTNAYETASPMKTATHVTNQVWSPRNTAILNTNSTYCTHSTSTLALPTTNDRRGFAYLENDPSVVFTLEQPGGLWGLSSKQQSKVSPTEDQESTSRSNNESSVAASTMPVIEKSIFSSQEHIFHPYQAPARQQSCSVAYESPGGEQQQRKEAAGTYSTDEQQADMLQLAWKQNYASKQLPTQTSAVPSPNIAGEYQLAQMTPINSHKGMVHVRAKAQSLMVTPVQTGLEGMHAYPAHIPEHHPTPMMNAHFSGTQSNEEVCKLTRPVLPKPSFLPCPLSPPTMTWSPAQPEDNVQYTSSHGQASLSSGIVNMGPAQGNQDGQLPAPQSCPHMPKIVHLPVTPRDMLSVTKLEPLHYPSYGYSPQLTYAHSFAHLPVHQQLVPIPLVNSLTHSIQCPWCPDPSRGCIVNPIPQQRKPSVTPQALQMMHWEGNRKVHQYPDALDMFKTANLLPEPEGRRQDVHLKVDDPRPRVAPNMIDMGLIVAQFPQKNIIPVKLKVQDDTSMEQPAMKEIGGDVANKNSTRVAEAITGDKLTKAKKTHQCATCKKFFSRPSSLKAHTRIHTGDKPYKCSFCSRTFPQASALQTHKRSHTGEKPFSCKECQHCFSHSSSLRTHMRTHTGEKPFHCTWQGCSKKFSDQSTLMKHRCVHTGEKPYACSVCGTRFTQLGNMKKHQMKIHGASQGKGHTNTPTEH